MLSNVLGTIRLQSFAASRLNAPYGAPCFLTDWSRPWLLRCLSLNAPFGARCFLPWSAIPSWRAATTCRNAPYGARCFLTAGPDKLSAAFTAVLMRLMALGAFSREADPALKTRDVDRS